MRAALQCGPRSLMEAQMRGVSVVVVSGIALAAASVLASPLPPKPSAIELGASPP
jgi:hypothetical protein